MVKVVVCLPIVVAILVVLVALRWQLVRENEILEEREGEIRVRKIWIFFCYFFKANLAFFMLTKIFNIILEATYAHHLPHRHFC